MANTIAGMFSTPEAIRDQRIAEIAAAQRQAAMPQGGRISDLNAVVAGGGYLTGQMMGEQLGGMLGMRTREEAKAQSIKNLFDETVAMSDGEFNLDTPENLTYFAKKLNDLGYSKEAMQMLEAAQ